MDDILQYFDYSQGLTPELYFKYIIFLTVIVVLFRTVGEMVNSVK